MTGITTSTNGFPQEPLSNTQKRVRSRSTPSAGDGCDGIFERSVEGCGSIGSKLATGASTQPDQLLPPNLCLRERCLPSPRHRIRHAKHRFPGGQSSNFVWVYFNCARSVYYGRKPDQAATQETTCFRSHEMSPVVRALHDQGSDGQSSSTNAHEVVTADDTNRTEELAARTTGGGTSLPQLIKSMSPTLYPTTYVFAHIPGSSTQVNASLLDTAEMTFREAEGLTAIVPQSVAEQASLRHEFPCKKITLNVHSSLDAVGFLAAITTRLAKNLAVGINPVSGFFHDHLFVPLGREHAVCDELKAMAAGQL